MEERSIGSVKGSVYWAYIKAWGAVWLPLSLIAAAFFERGVAVAQNYWLKVCTDLEDAWVSTWQQENGSHFKMQQLECRTK